MSAPLRIFYAAGPGDVIGTYRHWKQGRDDPSQVAITYSSQFYSLCQELGAQGYVLSFCRRRERISDGQFRIEHRRLRGERGPGALYHLGQIWYGLRMALSAARFGADVAIISGGTHWFMTGLMRGLGIKVVPTLHCVLWRKNAPPAGLLGRLVWSLNGRFFRKSAAGCLSLSNAITEQLSTLLRKKEKPILPFIPSYRPASFEGIAAPPRPPPFRVFYAGRIEANKGVFHLLEIAKRFDKEGRQDIEFDLCGEGSALQNLRQQANDANLSTRFRCHGHVEKAAMRQMYAAAHVVIAPTTTEFVEGFNKTVAEGVLAGRPVITSSVCPALEYVRDAVLEVPPDDVKAYGDAILRLCDDSALYESNRRGCLTSQPQFYDLGRSWGAAVRQMLKRLRVEKADWPRVAMMTESLPPRRMP
jgi:glycogen(starch) synthase